MNTNEAIEVYREARADIGQQKLIYDKRNEYRRRVLRNPSELNAKRLGHWEKRWAWVLSSTPKIQELVRTYRAARAVIEGKPA